MKKYKKEILIGVVAGVINGFFGAGGGCIVVLALEKFLNLSQKKAHSTAVGIILVISLSSSIVYLCRGEFKFDLWLPITLGGCLGGAAGAKFLPKISGKWLRGIFGAAMILASVKMIF